MNGIQELLKINPHGEILLLATHGIKLQCFGFFFTFSNLIDFLLTSIRIEILVAKKK